MQRLSLQQLAADADSYNEALRRAEHLDRFCSSLEWIFPAAQALMPRRDPWVFRGEHGYVTLMRSHHPSGFDWIEPFEASWGLACGLVGSSTRGFEDEVLELLEERTEWSLALISGLLVDARFTERLLSRFEQRYHVELGRKTPRFMARIGDGMELYLSRRSANLRRSLSKSQKRIAADGVTIASGHDEPDPAVLFDRIIAVEHKSWKGMDRVGIESGRMNAFYRHMVTALHRVGRHRVLFARSGDEDVGYLLGGVFDHGFRGLQCSYDERHARLGLGNLLQLEQIQRLVEEGVVWYDLGTTASHYKTRWSDETRDSTVIVLRR